MKKDSANRILLLRSPKWRPTLLLVLALCSGVGTLLWANPTGEQNYPESESHDSVQKEDLVLVWQDEFGQDGVPNPSNWNYEYGFVRNQELQWYQAQNAFCKNGSLIIEARCEKVPNPNYSPVGSDWRNIREFASYTSACLVTRGLNEWNAGGYFEVRARIDTSQGAWPAIWLLGTEGPWPDNGEIDMMEFYRINDTPHILANAAWGSAVQYRPKWDSVKLPFAHFASKDPAWASKFHTWSMSWNARSMKLFLDNELLNEVDLNKTVNANGENPFVGQKKFFLLLNLAVGANGGIPDDAAFPLTFEIDYVRVYQKTHD